MRHVLNSLAVAAPTWLLSVSHTEWKDHYVRQAEDDRLPTKEAERAALALTTGNDGWQDVECWVAHFVRVGDVGKTVGYHIVQIYDRS